MSLGPAEGAYSVFLFKDFRFPSKPLNTKKGGLFIPRFLLGLGVEGLGFWSPDPE